MKSQICGGSNAADILAGGAQPSQSGSRWHPFLRFPFQGTQNMQVSSSDKSRV